MEEKNAVITSVYLGLEDHGMLTAWLQLDYGGSGQGFGGYCLYSKSRNWQAGGNYTGHFVQRCLDVGGVDSWDKLPGKTIRVRANHSGIESIGHIIKDDWFTPSVEFKNDEPD